MTAQVNPITQKRTTQYWLNLAMAGLIVFYVMYVGWKWGQNLSCDRLGGDYCDYWAAGTVANHSGYAQVYDPQFMGPVVRGLAPWYTGDTSHPYLPVFTPAFQVLALFSPSAGYWVWVLCNTAALVLYLRFFARRTGTGPLPRRVILMVLISLPYFMNFATGQVDVWTAIFIGEFMRAMLDHKPFRAGLWLGGVILKPQVLVIIGLVLVVQRLVRVLAGLAVSGSVLTLVSLLMTGPQAFLNMIASWLLYGNSSVVPWVQGMMNWRMIGYHLANFTTPWLGWGIAAAGMLATAGLMLYAWRKPFDATAPSFPIAMVGVVSAAALLAWHSHLHLGVMLIVPLVYAYQRKILPERIWNYWIFFPALLHMAMVFIPATLIALGILPGSISALINGAIGAAEFSASLYLFAWAARSSIEGSQAAAKLAFPEPAAQ